MRHIIVMVLAALTVALTPGISAANEERCLEMFPGVEWENVETGSPTEMATAGMSTAMAERFAADVARMATLLERELGGMTGTAVCLATPELSDAFSDLVARGQRLHVGVFGEQRVLAMSAVETRMINDAIAFGLPHIALWQLADDLDLDAGYPDPLGATIAHWYLARDIDRLEQYRNEISVVIYLDDPNPEERTAAEAMLWVGDRKVDPYFFDPQFVGSQMGVFIDFAVATEGIDILRSTDQATWADLEQRWRISIRDLFPRGNFGVWIGVAIVIGFVSLAIVLALGKRYQKRKAARRRPTPPADESLFVSQIED